MEISLTKTKYGLIPADQNTMDWYENVRIGEIIHSDFKKVRNYKFLKKYFALLNLAFGYWEPGEINSKYGKPEKSFDRFRADVQILAGLYEVVIRLDGSTRIESKSISFANMSENEFSDLYNNVLNVILKRINVLCDMTADEVNKLVDQVLGFA